MDAPQVIVVGGGGTGGALAHDLVLRGLAMTLLERGELTSGTTGRHHGLLHSGGRYAVNDPESAVECIAENRILRRIAPGSFEENGGLFVALTDEDMDYLPRFLAGCAACGIPTRELTVDQALSLEPGLNPALKAAVWVPDATMDAMRLVVLIDASLRGEPGSLSVRRVEPHPATPATWSHHLDPEALADLAEALYGAAPPMVLVSVAAGSFARDDRLSVPLRRALPEVVEAVAGVITGRPSV